MLTAKSLLAAAGVAVMTIGTQASARVASDVVPLRGIVASYSDQHPTKIFLVNQKFKLVVDPARVPDMRSLRTALDASSRKSQTITLNIDPDTGSFSAEGVPTYVVRSVDLGSRVIGGDQQSNSTGPVTGAESDILRGIALGNAGWADRALPLLSAGIDNSSIKPRVKVWALKYRGNIRALKALGFLPPGEARDALLVASLLDVRMWEKLAPDDIEGARYEADLMKDLGAYDDALDINIRAYRRWPDERFWTLIDESIVYSEMNLPSLALDTLGEIVAEEGNQDGMAYHYHRGWALSDLGRYDEAVDEFTVGLKSQPDYAWAYVRRGCAFAALGDLPHAIADTRRALAYHMASSVGAPPIPGVVREQERLGQIVSSLAAAVRQDPHRKLRGLCSGFWDWGDEFRQRSRLLPP